MRLIGLAVVLAVSLILAPLAVEAQQPGTVSRIGVLELVIILTTAKALGVSIRQSVLLWLTG
jgi:hypothetical protein